MGSPGHPLHILQPLRHLDHPELRASAAVPESVGNQAHVGNGALLDGIVPVGQQIFRQHLGVRPHMGTVKVHQYLRTVNSFPVKRIIREDIGVIPCHFGGEEIFHPAALHDLGQGRAVAKGIRQPERIGGIVKILPCEFLSPYKLPYHVLAGRNVAVTLDPDTAVGLIAPLRHSLFDILKQIRIHPPDNIPMVGGTLYKGIIRILVHQIHLVRISPCALLFRLPAVPQPCRVHMGMTDESGIRRGGRIFLPHHLFQNSIGPPELLPENLRLLVFKIIGNQIVDFQHCPHKGCSAETLLLQYLHHLVCRLQIKVKLRQFLILQADIHRMILDTVKSLGFHQERLRSFNIMVRIILESHLYGFSALCLLAQHVTVMVSVAVHNHFGRIVAVGFPVYPHHSLIAPDFRVDE